MNNATLETDTEIANAFVTFHVQSPEVVSNVQTIQRELARFDSDFLHTFQPLQSLHVTLLLIHLSKDNFQKTTILHHSFSACDALAETAQYGQHQHQPLDVHFNSISHNGEASMYAKIKHQSAEWLKKMHSSFQSRGIPSLNPFHASHFMPHTTILYLRSEGDRKLIKWWADEEAKWAGKTLGTESVKVLQLCDISLDERTQDYNVLFEVPTKIH